MIIAREKKKNNIVEYVLYMWQIEDLIRLHNFDIEAIQQGVISQFDVPLDVKLDIKNWYLKLMEKMENEGVKESGHLAFLQTHVEELRALHHRLITIHQDEKYRQLFSDAKKNIDELISRSAGTVTHEIEACLTGLYGLLVLKLKKQSVSEETLEAMQTFSRMMAYLSAQYQLYRKGELKLSGVRNN